MYHLISPNELKQLSENRSIQILDIREPDEYGIGHLPGAKNVTELFYFLSESSDEGMAKITETFAEVFNRNGINSTEPVIIYEEEMDKKYGGSCRGAFIMTLLGHREVYVLHGGYSSWVKSGFQTSKETPEAGTGKFDISFYKKYFINYKEMAAAVGNSSIYILDNRDKDEWIGVSSSPYGVDYSPRKGRIPGAKWLEWYELMEEINDIPMFKSDEDIRKIAKSHGIEINSEIIIYCFKGSRAANTLLALKKAGYINVKVYFASWFEWAKMDELPVDNTILS